MSAIEPGDVIAIVVTHDSGHVVEACIKALNAASVPVIVVDNVSADDTLAVAEQHGARVISAPFNEGYGRANNRGVAAAESARWCLIVNPDLLVAADTVRRLRGVAGQHPHCAMVVPEIVEPDGRVFSHETTLLSPVSPPLPAGTASIAVANGASLREVAFASGACMLVRRDVFQELGGFDRNIFLFYEDDDLCLRLRRAGYAIAQATGVRVSHARGKSATPGPGRTHLVRYHQAWSRCYIAKKHGVRVGMPTFMLIQALKALGAAVTFNRRRLERHSGSVAGAWAALRGRSAFANEVEG